MTNQQRRAKNQDAKNQRKNTKDQVSKKEYIKLKILKAFQHPESLCNFEFGTPLDHVSSVLGSLVLNSNYFDHSIHIYRSIYMGKCVSNRR